MDDYDRRQYNMMRVVLSEIKERETFLSDRIYDLKSLYSNLHGPDNAWATQMDELWWILEEVYAFALYKNRSAFNEEEKKRSKKRSRS